MPGSGAFPQASAEPKPQEANPPPEAAAKAEPKKDRTSRLDWAGLLRHTFALDVFACLRCGGRRRVLIEMTMRYAHLAPEARESAVQQLDRPVPQLHSAPARDGGGAH